MFSGIFYADKLGEMGVIGEFMSVDPDSLGKHAEVEGR
jgi:hypothetical protein